MFLVPVNSPEKVTGRFRVRVFPDTDRVAPDTEIVQREFRNEPVDPRLADIQAVPASFKR